MNEEFLKDLRDRSIKVKLESDLKFGGAVDFKTLIDSLKAISKSYESYVKANFLNDLNQGFTEKEIRDTKLLKVDNQLLIVDLSFNSFEALITPDTKSYNSKIPYRLSGNKWKKETFQNFQTEVLFGDYNSESFRSELKRKYTAEARRQIFKPILDAGKSAELKFQNDRYPKPVKPVTIESELIYYDLIPEKVQEVKRSVEEKTYSVYLTSSKDPDLFGNRIIVDKLLGVEQLEKDTYPYSTILIEDEYDRIEFFEKQNFQVRYDEESELYIIESEELNLSSWGIDRASAEEAFDFMFLENYKSIALEKDSNLTTKAMGVKNQLLGMVKDYKHIQ